MDQYSQIAILKALFQGREDVFAIRWEKSGKSGYMQSHFNFCPPLPPIASNFILNRIFLFVTS